MITQRQQTLAVAGALAAALAVGGATLIAYVPQQHSGQSPTAAQIVHVQPAAAPAPVAYERPEGGDS